MTDPAQRAESVKIRFLKIIITLVLPHRGFVTNGTTPSYL